MTSISVEKLAELLVETGHRHHSAYITSDGTDPEWALWYASFLQAHLWDRTGALPTRSRLVHLLVEAEKQARSADQDVPWSTVYAEFILRELQRDEQTESN